MVKNGRQIVATKTFDLKRDADTWHDIQKRQLALGDIVDPKAGKVTLSRALQDWMTAREGTVAGSTFQEEGYTLKRIPTTLGNRPVNTVRPADLDALYATLLRKLARSSVMRFRNTLSSFYSWAQREGMVAANPVLLSKVPKGTGTDARREMYPFNLEELKALHAELKDTIAEDKLAADIVLVLGLTGLRWGELAALRVRDVQMVPYPALKVSRSRPDGQKVRTVTKGGGTRTVPLLDVAAEVVKPLLTGDPNSPLFPSSTGSMRLLSNFKRVTKWSEVSRGRRIHDLRHTAATFWVSQRIDMKTIQTWLGHSTSRLTMDTYAHWMGLDSDAAAILRLNAVVAEAGYAGGTRVTNLRATE